MFTYSQLTFFATTVLFTHRSNNKNSIVYPSDPRFDDGDDDDHDDEVCRCVAKLC